MARQNKADQYQYIIDWLNESVEARRAQNAIVERTIMAYQGKPSINRYTGSVNAYITDLQGRDKDKADKLRESMKDMPNKMSMVINDGVEAVVSMVMGGVGRFEFAPYDPNFNADPKLIDMLSAAAKSFYNENKIDSLVPEYVRQATLAGASYLHLKQKNKKMCLTMIDTSRMYTDPKRNKTNIERFIGHSERASWRDIKDRLKKTSGGGYMVKTMNDVDVYLSQILMELNDVNTTSGTTTGATSSPFHDELRKDIDQFYAPIVTRIQDYRKEDPEYNYSSDDIDIAYVYDLMNDMEFHVINRRYIVYGSKNKIRRDLKLDVLTIDNKTKKINKEISLDHPYIELPYMNLFYNTFPTSPLVEILDDFDDLCAMESVLFHTLSIMGPITFIGQSSDAEKVARAASISGEIVEGLPQTFGVMNKSHDLQPLLTAIDRAEQKIKKRLKAMDPFQMQAMIGDRASAKEVAALSGQISQGLNPFVANIETAMATLGEKMMTLRLILNDGAYPFTYDGRYAELAPEDMAMDFQITAKLTSSIKLEQEAQSQKAMQTIQYMGNTDKIDPKNFFGTLLPILFAGLVTREQAVAMIAEPYRPMPEETIAKIRKHEQEEAAKDPIDKMDFSEASPEDLDALIAEFSGMTAGGVVPGGAAPTAPFDPNAAQPQLPPELDPSVVNQEQPLVIDPNAMQTAPAGQPTVQDPTLAGTIANDPNNPEVIV